MTGAILLVHEREDREYLREPGDRLETDLGVVEIPTDVAPGDVLETHLGEPFRVRRLRGPDLFEHLERTGAPMMPRDVGLVLGLTGVETTDRVLDVGTGTGVLAAYCGRIGAEVLTYERDAEFAGVARGNMETAGVADRVEVRNRDITEDLDSLSGFDVLALDTGDAPDIVARAPGLLGRGGHLAAYCPFVERARAVDEAARNADLTEVRTHETIQREMDFDERGSRPSTAGVGHTGFLTIGRRP